MDNLLKSEGPQNSVDTLNNRQLAKISFLLQESKQQHEYILDLKYMLKLNKEAMKILLNSKNNNSNNDSDKTESNLSATNLSPNKNLVEHLFEENHRLVQSIENLIKERNIAQSKALISQQIAEEADNHCSVLENELEEKIIELKRIIQDKEFTIQDLEKTTPLPLKDGNFMIFKEIMSPNEKVLKLTTENENLIKNLNFKAKTESNLKSKLENATFKMNNLKQELLKIRFALTNPVNTARLRNYITENINSFSDNEDIEFLHNYYNMREINLKEQNEMKSLIEKKRSIFIGNKRVEINTPERKIGSILKKSDKYQKDQNKIEELQNEILNFQKLFERESLNNKLLLNDLTTIRKENEKILQTNDTLLHSINLMKANLEKLKIENSYYKEYFYKFIHSIKHKSRYSISDLTLLEQPDKQHQETCEKTKTSPKLVIYQVNKNEIEDTGSLQIDIRKTKEFLINLAKDFYLNTKIRNFYNINQNLLKICDITNTQMKSNEIKNFLRPKRCLSNPLLYIQEKAINLSEEPSLVKRKRFFKKKENRKKIAFKNKTEMEKLMMGSPMPSIYDIKNGVNTPFLLDISKIIPFNFEHSFME